MYFIWKRSPLLRIALTLCTGVFVSDTLSVLPLSLLFCLLFIPFTLLLLCVAGKQSNFSRRNIPGILFTLLFFLTGVLLVQISNPQLADTHYSHYIENANAIGVKLRDAPAGNNGYYRCTAEVVAVVSGNTQMCTAGLISLQFVADSLRKVPTVDEVIWVKSAIDSLREPVNPGEFNYSEFLRRKGILFSVFANDDQWRQTDGKIEVTLKGWLVEIRESLLSRLKAHGVGGREYAVLAALLLGKTSDIDKELMLFYSGAGAVHILAVSGLHVALIYVLLAPLFNNFFPGKKHRLLKTFLPSLLLWIYAGITGFSSSVLRAALMFTCFIIADNFQKENNIYNTIGASVVLLILWQPNIAFETGFQLSYLAVLGIVLLQKRILAFCEPSTSLLDKSWKLIAVSIAAQIATLPYTLFYFDQFPTWFLLTNLLVIPLSTVILYCGLGSFALLWWSDGADFTLGLTSFLTRLMNDLMIFIGKLPFAVIDAIHLDKIDFVLLSLLMVLGCRWMLWYHARSLLYAQIVLFFFLINQMFFDTSSNEQAQVCFHAIRKGDAISITCGRETWIYADSTLMHDEMAKRNYFKNYHTDLGIRDVHERRLDSLSVRNQILMLGDSLICVMHESLLSDARLPDAGYYYFPSQFKGKERLLKNGERFIGRTLIFSASLSDHAFRKWVKQMPNSTCCFHLRPGAMVINADHEFKKFDAE
jgi:competence protein ComEC